MANVAAAAADGGSSWWCLEAMKQNFDSIIQSPHVNVEPLTLKQKASRFVLKTDMYGYSPSVEFNSFTSYFGFGCTMLAVFGLLVFIVTSIQNFATDPLVKSSVIGPMDATGIPPFTIGVRFVRSDSSTFYDPTYFTFVISDITYHHQIKDTIVPMKLVPCSFDVIRGDGSMVVPDALCHDTPVPLYGTFEQPVYRLIDFEMQRCLCGPGGNYNCIYRNVSQTICSNPPDSSTLRACQSACTNINDSTTCPTNITLVPVDVCKDPTVIDNFVTSSAGASIQFMWYNQQPQDLTGTNNNLQILDVWQSQRYYFGLYNILYQDMFFSKSDIDVVSAYPMAAKKLVTAVYWSSAIGTFRTAPTTGLRKYIKMFFHVDSTKLNLTWKPHLFLDLISSWGTNYYERQHCNGAIWSSLGLLFGGLGWFYNNKKFNWLLWNTSDDELQEILAHPTAAYKVDVPPSIRVLKATLAAVESLNARAQTERIDKRRNKKKGLTASLRRASTAGSDGHEHHEHHEHHRDSTVELVKPLDKGHEFDRLPEPVNRVPSTGSSTSSVSAGAGEGRGRLPSIRDNNTPPVTSVSSTASSSSAAADGNEAPLTFSSSVGVAAVTRLPDDRFDPFTGIRIEHPSANATSAASRPNSATGVNQA